MKEVEKHSGEDVTIMVLANKSDAEDDIEVSDNDIRKFEEENKIKVTKVSAKTGANVDDSFLDMTKKLIVKKNNSGEDKRGTMGLRMLKQSTDGPQGSSAGNACCSWYACVVCLVNSNWALLL